MISVAPIIRQVLLDRILHSAAPVASNNKIGWGIYALSGLFAGAGFVFLLLAGNVWLQNYYAPEIALAITGGSALTTSLIAALGAMTLQKRRKKHTKMHLAQIIQNVDTLLDNIGEELEGPIKSNPKTAMMAAAMAGFVAGENVH